MQNLFMLRPLQVPLLGRTPVKAEYWHLGQGAHLVLERSSAGNGPVHLCQEGLQILL